MRKKCGCLNHSNERIFHVNIQMQGWINACWKGSHKYKGMGFALNELSIRSFDCMVLRSIHTPSRYDFRSNVIRPRFTFERIHNTKEQIHFYERAENHEAKERMFKSFK